VSKDDPRVKLCATLDPWLFAYHKEIQAGEYALSIPKLIVSTFHFHPTGEKVFPSWQALKDIFKFAKDKR
jgi:hypothetical protein